MIALLLVAAQALDSLRTPLLRRIDVEKRAVWFLPDRYRVDSAGTAYVGTWQRTPPVGRLPAPPSWPTRTGERVPLGLGIDLVLVPVGNATVPGVLSASDNRISLLRPEFRPEDRRRLQPLDGQWLGLGRHAAIDTLPLAGFSGVWAQGDTDVWFGLNGGFSGGLGGLGGLVRFNRKTGRVESVWTDELLQAPVTGLAVSDDALWVGTTKGGYGQPGRVGLLRYDLKTSTWRRYTAENSALPGNLISVIAADGDRLWVATENGIGALDTRTSAWTVWSFALGLDGDTVVHELVEGRRPPDDVRAGIFALMLRLQVTAREPFLRACLGVATDRFAALTRSEDRADTLAIAALAQPPLVPFLVTALGRTGEPRYLAASALGRLRDPQLIPTLRAALDSSAPAGTGAVATALGLLGDSAGYRWMRSHLYVGGGWNVLEFVRAAARLRDRGSISQLATLLRIGPRGDAYAALAAIGTPEAWRTIAKEVAYPAEKRRLFEDFLHPPPAMPVPDSAFRAALGANATVIATNSDDPIDVRQLAAEVVVRLGRMDAASRLLGYYRRSQDDYRLGNEILIRLTGIDAVPAPPAADSTQRERAYVFWSQWLRAQWHTKTAAGMRAVPLQQGDAALERWRQKWGHADRPTR
ncbi:MAG TPA: HEAT repeat domain-containing protein [Gemmatimonadales bacterium]|nr:HEAT repeat domain-containing protein [Gemmatimonadales bacterium]